MLIKLDFLNNKYNIKANGVLHVGANYFQEREDYKRNGLENVYWVDALPETFNSAKEILKDYPTHKAYNVCVGDKDGEVVQFNVSSNKGESSSIFDFGTHTTNHPEVSFVSKIQLTTKRLDTFLRIQRVDVSDFFLNLDIQGAELMALKGLGNFLKQMKYIYCEVNTGEVYKGVPKLHEIDEFLERNGFDRVELSMTGAGWGDAFYIRREPAKSALKFAEKRYIPKLLEEFNDFGIPKLFTPKETSKYPSDNEQIFEEWFASTYKGEVKDREYLPIMWTAYYKNHNFGNDTLAIKQLQSYLDKLDKSKKYFTICQFDLGVINDLSNLDIKVFGMCDEQCDYILPLICKPHGKSKKTDKKYLANFVGRLTNPLRSEGIKSLRNNPNYYISTDNHSMQEYCDIMAQSVFTLCFRGFGLSSFRIMEAVEQGSIPVYISDKHLYPYGLTKEQFERFGIVISEAEINDIDIILQSYPEKQIWILQENCKAMFNEFFTYEGVKKTITNKFISFKYQIITDAN